MCNLWEEDNAAALRADKEYYLRLNAEEELKTLKETFNLKLTAPFLTFFYQELQRKKEGKPKTACATKKNMEEVLNDCYLVVNRLEVIAEGILENVVRLKKIYENINPIQNL